MIRENFPYADATIYQISLRSFTPEGTISSAMKMLPFISEFGANYVQLCPVVESDPDTDRQFWSERQKASQTENPRNSYRIRDYFSIDPEYGSESDLHEFVQVAHRCGLKVILDLVYYHCGPTAVFLDEHPDFVLRNDDGTPYCGHWHFPVLNYESSELREYLWNNMTYFVEKFDIDGYRCDVGDMIPLDFWTEGIKRVRAIKKDVFMINEGRNPEYLKIFDANYFYDGSHDAPKIANGELPVSSFRKKWQACRDALPNRGRMLRFIDNHDIASDSYEDRHEKLIGPDGVDALLVLDFTLDGIPFLFNGYEIIDDLKHNLFSNREYGRDASINWANALTNRGKQRLELVTQLHRLRKGSGALCSNNLVWLEHDRSEQILGYRRQVEQESIIVLINLSKKPVSAIINADVAFPAATQTMLSHGASYSFHNGQIKSDILPYGYLVIKE